MAIKKAVKTTGDPLDLNGRLYQQLGRLLDDMERADRDELMTMPQRIQALIAVGRVQKMFQDLKKGEYNAGAGSAVSRYAAAFQTPHATGGRDERGSRPSNIVQLDRSDERDDEDRDEFDA
jgi:hypothetical protein